MKHFKTTETVQVEDYPYGRLRATVFFSLEHKTGKGFRTVFQSINPKTSRVNKPKKSTYSPILAMYRADNGHIKYEHYSMYDDEAKRRALLFMAGNFGIYTEKQIEDIAGYMLMMLKVDIKAKNVYCNSPLEKLFPLYEDSVKTLVSIIKTGENLFSTIDIDFDSINALEEKDYNPFTTVHHLAQ